jgi:hypothetical protein
MFTKFFDTVMADPSIAPTIEAIENFIEPLGLFIGIALVSLLLGLGFFGQRIFGFVRWVLVFMVGFLLGAGVIAPLLQTFAPALNPLIFGLLIGLILAVLSGFIYNVVFVAVIGFDTFNICFNALYFPALVSLTKGNIVVSAVITVVAIIIALNLRKYVEMIITSGIAGIAIAFAVKSYFYDFTAIIPLAPAASAVIIGLVISTVMYIYQYRNRIRF